MRCVNCSSTVGSDEAVFLSHPEYQTPQPYCMDCEPPDYPDTLPDDDEEKNEYDKKEEE